MDRPDPPTCQPAHRPVTLLGSLVARRILAGTTCCLSIPQDPWIFARRHLKDTCLDSWASNATSEPHHVSTTLACNTFSFWIEIGFCSTDGCLLQQLCQGLGQGFRLGKLRAGSSIRSTGRDGKNVEKNWIHRIWEASNTEIMCGFH